MNDQNTPVICEADREELVGLGYSESELKDVEVISRRLCTTARLYLARIFVRARVCRKPRVEVMAACTKMWADTWRYGTTGRLGDPDDTWHDMGMRHTVAFYSLYQVLGIPIPKFLF